LPGAADREPAVQLRKKVDFEPEAGPTTRRPLSWRTYDPGDATDRSDTPLGFARPGRRWKLASAAYVPAVSTGSMRSPVLVTRI